MRFVKCEIQPGNHNSLELSGFEITILITELLLLESILEKYFRKLKGLANLKAALLESHQMLNKGGKLDFLEFKILVAIPGEETNKMLDDLVYIQTAFSEIGCKNIVEYGDTFNKLITLQKEMIKLSDSDNELVFIPADAVVNSNQSNINLN